MNNALQQTIEALAREKGIEANVIITAIEDAVLTASRKYYKSDENLRTKFNSDTGQVDLFAVRQIVEEVTDPATEIALAEAQELYGDEAEPGMEIEFPKPTDVLGRIAAQTAKQVIFQKVREAERENVFAEYSQRVGEVINGLVKRFESGDIIVEVGRVEAQLPRREQSRAENYTTSDRVRAVIKDVNKNTKGPQIILSRTDPVLLIKLFEQEVPEIYDGTVVIRGAVREAGDRAKVAVASRERDVDPVGACVGMKGTRVQAIIRELRGEKIDIVAWSDDAVTFVTNAISPARVQRVSVVDETERVVEVVVRGPPALAGHRQEGPECPLGGQADRLEDRHQERRGETAGGRGRIRRAWDRTRTVVGAGARRGDGREAERRRYRDGGADGLGDRHRARRGAGHFRGRGGGTPAGRRGGDDGRGRRRGKRHDRGGAAGGDRTADGAHLHARRTAARAPSDPRRTSRDAPPAKTGRPRRWLARMETRRTRGWTRSVTAERRRSRPTRAGTRQGRRRTTRNLRRVTS